MLHQTPLVIQRAINYRLWSVLGQLSSYSTKISSRAMEIKELTLVARSNKQLQLPAFFRSITRAPLCNPSGSHRRAAEAVAASLREAYDSDKLTI